MYQKFSLYLIQSLSFFKYQDVIILMDSFLQQEKLKRLSLQNRGQALFKLMNLTKISMSLEILGKELRYHEISDIPPECQEVATHPEDIKFYYKLNLRGFLLQLLTNIIIIFLGRNSKWISKLYK